MTSSATRSASFTITDARYVAAKIGADLRLLNSLYGQPALSAIPNYVEEVALLLRDGYLGTVDFGFKSGDVWKLRLRYTATIGGHLVDSWPGSLPTSAALAGLSFYSYLIYSTAFWQLTTAQRDAVKAALPIRRSDGVEPSVQAGSWASGHGYSRNGAGVARDVYSAY